MINISREPKIPEALDTQEIQDYVTECLEYKADPANNPKPKKPAGYRTCDLLEAFDRCFFSKCYLTEEKFYNSWKMDVEHFVPQNEEPTLIYDWNNLYPAEHKANMIKPRSTPVGGYLDPCNVDDNVETEIIYTLSGFGSRPNFTPGDPGRIKVVNTCNLLERVHNGHNDESEKNMADLRHGIQKRYIELLEKICLWRSHNMGTQEEVQLRNEIKLILSRKSSFTMLLRSAPAVIHLNNEFPNLFFD